MENYHRKKCSRNLSGTWSSFISCTNALQLYARFACHIMPSLKYNEFWMMLMFPRGFVNIFACGSFSSQVVVGEKNHCTVLKRNTCKKIAALQQRFLGNWMIFLYAAAASHVSPWEELQISCWSHEKGKPDLQNTEQIPFLSKKMHSTKHYETVSFKVFASQTVAEGSSGPKRYYVRWKGHASPKHSTSRTFSYEGGIKKVHSSILSDTTENLLPLREDRSVDGINVVILQAASACDKNT